MTDLAIVFETFLKRFRVVTVTFIVLSRLAGTEIFEISSSVLEAD